ncbi:ABC transporter substrate-binding protein [Microvirga flavescens]|uniref:ABC transporter substrate-binding protein n=1 Tax=Microvirga flavescens TaxID=2249811 RepID=UPI001FDEE456|nr:ABC transporter substrate-binding protein [Microvirga flavescens]
MLQLPIQRFLAGLLLAMLAPGFGAALAEARPQRIASINLCTDQLLLALADREQIVSLSRLAKDRSISFFADRVGNIPLNSGTAEAVLFSKADLVLAGPFGQQAATELLRRQGFEVLTLDPWRNLEHGREQVRELARRVGHPERGEKLIAEIDAALARTKDIVPSGRSVLVYYRGGWVPATDSLMGEILRHMGFKLHQEKIGLQQGGMTRLENIVSVPPDYIFVDEGLSRAVDNGSALFIHPALTKAVPAGKRLAIAGNLPICGGPSTPATIEALGREIRAKVH